MEVLLAAADGQPDDNSISDAANGLSNSVYNQDVLESVTHIIAFGEVEVEGVADLVYNIRHASVDLSRQIPSNDREIMDVRIAGTGRKPLESKDFVLCFSGSDRVLRLISKPLGIAGRQDNRRPVE